MNISNAFGRYLLPLCMFLTACDPKPHQPKTPTEARLNIEDEPQSLDPRKARSLSSGTILRMLFDGLTRLDADENAQLAIAEKVGISKDKKIYTFHLRKSQWTNGDPVTAEDFLYAWKQVLDPQFPSDNAYQMYVIKNAKECKKGECSFSEVGVEAIDALTLQVQLEHPVPYFLELLAYPVFFPINHKVDQSDPQWAEHRRSYVSNGPFQMDYWKHHDELRLKKNPTYWDAGTVRLDRIQMTMVQDSTAMQMFEKQELDWAGSPLSSIPTALLPELKKEGTLRVKPMLGTYFFRINVELAPLNNSSIRKALALALNREEIVKHVLQGEQLPATSLVPVSMQLSDSPLFQDAHIEEARRLLKEGLIQEGIAPSSFPEVTLTYAASEKNRSIAQAVQQQWWQALGIHVQLEAVEAKVFFSRISHQDFQMAACSWTADFNDPVNFLEVFKYKKASTNNTHWEDPKYIELLEASAHASDLAQRKQLLQESERLLIDAMPIIPLFHYSMLYVQNEGIKDIVISSLGVMDFKYAYREAAENKSIANGKPFKESKPGETR